MRAEKTVNVQIGTKEYAIVSDDDYLEQIKDGFEPLMVSLFGCLVSPQDHVLDIGANIGCTSLLFGELARRVLSFEPSPTTFAFLERNVRASGLGNIEVQNFALGSEPCESQITFAPNNRAGAFVSDKTKTSVGHTTERIQVKRLDDVVAALGISRVDFVKIDVEGFEKYVIDGAWKTIDQFKPIIVLELNHWCLNAFQRITIPEFFDHLRSIFPILLAVEGTCYADLHSESERYRVMYHHIIHFKYVNIVAAFNQDQLFRFHAAFKHESL